MKKEKPFCLDSFLDYQSYNYIQPLNTWIDENDFRNIVQLDGGYFTGKVYDRQWNIVNAITQPVPKTFDEAFDLFNELYRFVWENDREGLDESEMLNSPESREQDRKEYEKHRRFLDRCKRRQKKELKELESAVKSELPDDDED